MIFAAMALLLATGPVLLRSTIIENVRYCSPDGRSCLVMRQLWNVPDLKGKRADEVFRFAIGESSMPAGLDFVFTQPNRGHYAGGPALPASTAALYDGRRRVATIELDFQWRGGEVLVPDSGRYVVLLPVGGWNNERYPAVWIYKTDGAVRHSLFAEEIFSPGDRLDLSIQAVTPSIRENLLLLTFPPAPEAIRIDLDTGSRLGELRDIFPPRVRVTESAGAPGSAGVACADEAAGAIAIDSAQLLARAIEKPLPEYTRTARFARVQGSVAVDVIVSENGQVICAGVSALPFGLSQAAETAARGWRFTPWLVDGRPVKIRGDFLFHFQLPPGVNRRSELETPGKR